MTKRIILTTLTVLLGTISGQAFAYSNVSPKPAREVVSDQHAPDRFAAFDQIGAQQVTKSDSYRYRGGPKSTD